MTLNALTDRHLLVVEDEFLIAYDLADRLTEAGATVLGPVGFLDEAHRLVQRTARIDAAILDINLQGDMIYPLADLLAARRVPILFVSGYDATALPERFRCHPHSGKPAPIDAILALIKHTVPS